MCIFSMLFFSACLALTAQVQPSSPQADEALLSYIQIIEEHESSVHGLVFDVRYSTPTFKWVRDRWVQVDENDFGNIVPETLTAVPGGVFFRSASVVYDVDRSAFKVHGIAHLVKQLSDSTIAYSKEIESYADDSIEFTKYTKVFNVRELPDWNIPPEQWPGVITGGGNATIDIRANQSEYLPNGRNFLSVYGESFGIGWIVPFVSPWYEPPTRISDLLRRRIAAGEKVVVITLDDGNWEITFGMPFGFKFFYDPRVGRVHRIEWGGCKKCPDLELTPGNWLPSRVAQFEYEDEHSMVPNSVSIVNIELTPGTFEEKKPIGRRWLFSNVQLNPEFNQNAFQVLLENGTLVENHINKKLYVQGGGLEHDESSTRDFLRRNGLLVKRQPMEREAPSAKTSSRMLVFIYINVVIAILIISVFAYRLLKRRKGTS